MDYSVASDRLKVGWKQISSQTIILDGEEARKFAATHRDLPNSPTERVINKKRVKELQFRISQDMLIPFVWSRVDWKGVSYRMNGHHSSIAICDYSGPLPAGMTFHVTHNVAHSREGMGKLFGQHDARWSARSKQDVGGAYLGLEPQLSDCDPKMMSVALEGILFYRHTVLCIPVQSRSEGLLIGDQVNNLYFDSELHSYFRWYDSLLLSKTPEMRYGPVAAAMHVTFLKSESAAREFWKKVSRVDPDVENGHDPASLIWRCLWDHRSGADPKKHLLPGPMYYLAIKAWNAFRTGEKFRALTFQPNKGFPDIEA